MKLEIILLIALPIALGTIFYLLNRKKKVATYKIETAYYRFNSPEFNLAQLIDNYNGFYRLDKLATKLALAHSIDMMNDKAVSHYFFTERAKELLSKGAKSYNEIVGMASSIESLFEKFLASPDHKAVIDNLKYNAIGIGITYKPSIYYCTVIFFEV